MTATPQNVTESVQSGSPRHRVWQRVVFALASLAKDDPETPAATNLLVGLFSLNAIAAGSDAEQILRSWQAARLSIAGTIA